MKESTGRIRKPAHKYSPNDKVTKPKGTQKINSKGTKASSKAGSSSDARVKQGRIDSSSSSSAAAAAATAGNQIRNQLASSTFLQGANTNNIKLKFSNFYCI